MPGDPALMAEAVRRLGREREESMAHFVRAMAAAGYSRAQQETFIKLHWLCGLQVRTYIRIALDPAANRDALVRIERLIRVAMPDVGMVGALSTEELREYTDLAAAMPEGLTHEPRDDA